MDYELSLELAENLETVKKYHLENSPVVTLLATLIFKHRIYDQKLLNETAESLLSINAGKTEATTHAIAQEITPQGILDAEILAKEILPLVSEIRKDVFDKEEIPFLNRESVSKWLSKYALSDQDLIDEYLKKKELSIEGEATFRALIIEGMAFPQATPPAIIYDKTLEIANDTGINHPSLVMHVLANTNIVCSKWNLKLNNTRYRLPSGIMTEIKGIEVRFRDTLNLEDMRQIYSAMRDNYKFKKSKVLNAKHLLLYRFVEERKLPYKKGKVAFWKQITEEWNRRYPELKYTTWKGVNMAYNRILKNVDRRLYGGTQ